MYVSADHFVEGTNPIPVLFGRFEDLSTNMDLISSARDSSILILIIKVSKSIQRIEIQESQKNDPIFPNGNRSKSLLFTNTKSKYRLN